MKTFFDLFSEEVKDMYGAEKQLIRALPEMAAAAHTPDLKEAFLKHLEETRTQAARLEEIAAEHNIDLAGADCEAMRGIIQEGSHYVKSHYPSEIKDAALIGAAQRVEHYEIAVYGVLRTFAKHLKFKRALELLDDSLQEEGHADKVLTKIAEGSIFTTGVNAKASKNCCC